MKKVIIPTAQKDICIDALKRLQKALIQYTDHGSDSINHVVFDITGLIGLLDGRYKLSVELSEADADTFVSRHSVDLPLFVEEQKQMYKVAMTRTYETEFLIEATSEAEAKSIFESLGDAKYEAELKNMNVIDETISITL